MKKRCVVFIVVFLVLILGSTVLLIAQDKSERAFEEDSSSNSYDSGNFPTTDDAIQGEEAVEGKSLGGGSSGGSGDGNSGSELVVQDTVIVCRNQTIKYSLKNFQENVNCLDNENGKCILVNAICSVDVYNIDVDSFDNFTIDYVLVDSFEKELDSQLLSMNVNTSVYMRFLANMTIEDSDGIDVLSKCNPRIISVPKKEVCS